MKTITNRKQTTCTQCGATLAPGVGVAVSGKGRWDPWKAYCTQHAPSQEQGHAPDLDRMLEDQSITLDYYSYRRSEGF